MENNNVPKVQDGSGVVETSASVKSVYNESVTFWLNPVPGRNILQENTLNLASIIVPRIAHRLATENSDEPWAWEAREFLRKKLVSEKVKLRKEYTIDRVNFGSVFLLDGTSISHLLLRNGYAKVRPTSTSPNSPNVALDYQELVKIQAEARKKEVGLWNQSHDAEKTKRKNLDGTDDPHLIAKFVEEHLNQKLNGIVEYVRDGGFLNVYFPDYHIIADVSLTGITCDGYKRNTTGDGTVVAEPYADETKHFVEFRLLQRDVQVRIEGCDSYSTLFGTVYRDGKSITPRLLEVGFAKINDLRVRLCENPSALREMMRQAQQKRIGKWKHWKPTVSEESKEYTAKVIEVNSGDSLTVIPVPDSDDYCVSEERRLYMASIRCPRLGGRHREDEPFAFEAKDFLRRHIIGKRVQVTVAYIREPTVSTVGAQPPPSSDSSGKMHFVSIQLESSGGSAKDIGEMMVDAGLAKVLVFRNDDDSAPNFDELRELEQAAKEAKKGIHGEMKGDKVQKIVELLGVENSDRARSFESELKKKETIEGVVEYCFSPAMFKIRISSLRLAIKFQIAGIAVPQFARPPQTEDDPLAREAQQFARQHILQRTVTLKVEACERSGTFTGILNVGKELFGVKLIEQGLASVITGSQIRAKTAARNELLAAEKIAREEKRGIWALEQPQTAVEEKDLSTNLPKVLNGVDLVHTNSVTDFFIHGEDKQQVEKLQNNIADSIHSLAAYSDALPPKRNDIVIAKFEEDGNWYRGRVIKYDRDDAEARVFFLDFGNEDIIGLNNIRRSHPEFSLWKIPAQAMRCKLSGLKECQDFAGDAARQLHDLCGRGIMECTIEKIERSDNSDEGLVNHTVLSVGEGALSVNEILAQLGLCFFDRNTKSSIKDKLLAAQTEAKKKRLNIWEHGDVEGCSDDETDKKIPDKKIARR